MKATQITDRVTYHGEGAVWSEAWGGLKLVDMLAGDVLTFEAGSGTVSRRATGSDVAAMVRPVQGGGEVVVTRHGLVIWRDGQPDWVSPPLVGEEVRFNEGGVDRFGRLYCGTIHDSRTPGSAALWRLTRSGAEAAIEGVTVSNGLAFDADGSRAYYIDSPTRRVDVLDVSETDGLVDRRPFVVLGDDVAGNPDGVCTDVDGGIWVAFYRGGAVRHYDADGALDAVIEVPGVSRVTSCALGNGTLYITTSRENLPDDAEPAAGAVFAADVGVEGVPVRAAAL